MSKKKHIYKFTIFFFLPFFKSKLFFLQKIYNIKKYKNQRYLFYLPNLLKKKMKTNIFENFIKKNGEIIPFDQLKTK